MSEKTEALQMAIAAFIARELGPSEMGVRLAGVLDELITEIENIERRVGTHCKDVDDSFLDMTKIMVAHDKRLDEIEQRVATEAVLSESVFQSVKSQTEVLEALFKRIVVLEAGGKQ